jgi:hypothetical protein
VQALSDHFGEIVSEKLSRIIVADVKEETASGSWKFCDRIIEWPSAFAGSGG